MGQKISKVLLNLNRELCARFGFVLGDEKKTWTLFGCSQTIFCEELILFLLKIDFFSFPQKERIS